MDSALAKSTQSTYNRGCIDFDKFRGDLGLDMVWPAPLQHIISYVSHLSLQGRAPSTIDTYVAALAYRHKICGWEDPTDNFIIRKLKEGAKRGNKVSDRRRPITLLILGQLLSSLPGICASSFEAGLFKAAFSLAFFGFLRVGEFTSESKKGEGANILSFRDVKFDNAMLAMEVHVRSSKTDQRGEGTKLQIYRGPSQDVCPVQAVSEYLQMRPVVNGPLFIHFGGSPLTRYQFSAILRKGIRAIGLHPGDFSPHSFRIGAATSAALGGASVENIMGMGRWRSAAVNTYIRPSRIVVPKSWAF